MIFKKLFQLFILFAYLPYPHPKKVGKEIPSSGTYFHLVQQVLHNQCLLHHKENCHAQDYSEAKEVG